MRRETETTRTWREVPQVRSREPTAQPSAALSGDEPSFLRVGCWKVAEETGPAAAPIRTKGLY